MYTRFNTDKTVSLYLNMPDSLLYLSFNDAQYKYVVATQSFKLFTAGGVVISREAYKR